MDRDDYEVINKFSKNQLITHGFRYLYNFSDDEEHAFSYRFPVYKYGLSILLECEVVIFLPSNTVWVNIFDRNSRDRYAPYYYYEYGNYQPVLDIINNNLKRELIKLGIKKKNDNSRGKVSDVQKRRCKRKPKIKDIDILQC